MLQRPSGIRAQQSFTDAVQQVVTLQRPIDSRLTRLYDHYPREKLYHRAGYYVHKVSVHLVLD